MSYENNCLKFLLCTLIHLHVQMKIIRNVLHNNNIKVLWTKSSCIHVENNDVSKKPIVHLSIDVYVNSHGIFRCMIIATV